MKKLIYRSCRCLCKTTIFVVLVNSFVCGTLYVYTDWFLGKDFVKMVKESVMHISTSRTLLRSEKHPIPKKGPPFILARQTRYPGEDAMFSCTAKFDDTISEVRYVLWLKNTKAVVNGTNHYITWEVADYSENLARVTTNLTIYSVTEDDYGMYQCHVVLWDSVKSETDTKQTPKPKPKQQTGNVGCFGECVNCPVPRMPDFTKEYIALLFYLVHKVHWAGEFHLLREKNRIRTLFIVPGTLISVAVYFRHLREIDDFSVRFTRSGQDIQSFETQCSYSAEANAILIHMAGITVDYNNVTYQNATDVDHWKAKVGIIWSCISPSMYGVYRITIRRKVYNKSDGIQWTEQIDYPTKVYIKPKASTIVTENISNNKNRAVVVYNENCWSDEELEPENCNNTKTLVESIFDKNILYESVIKWKSVVLLCVAIIISGIVQFFIWPFCRCKLLQFCCVLRRSGNKVLAGIQVNPDIQYHLYISSVSADRSFIAQNILPVLKRLNLKVFNGQDDILPGKVEITEISNAINKSLKCMVIASNEYIESALQNDFEINCILKTRSICKVLIVNVDNCSRHEMFDKMYKVINCSRDGWSEQDRTILMQWVVNYIEFRILLYLLIISWIFCFLINVSCIRVWVFG